MTRAYAFVFFLSFVIEPLLVSAAFTAHKNCSISPFAVSFGNVTVLNDPDLPGAHRGAQVFIGSLRKRLSVGIGTTMNSSFIPDGEMVCNTSAPDARECIFWRGGLFAPASSNTWAPDKRTIPYNGSAENSGFDALHAEEYQGLGEDPLGDFPRGWDTIVLPTTKDGENIVMDGYPLTIIDNSSFPFGAGMFGLASDSRTLDQAVGSGMAPSHTWGLDYGTTGVYAEGEFVIGGYNPAKAHMDKAQHFKVFADKTISCPLQVKVKSVALGGTAKGKLNTKTFTACLEPALWSLVLPLEVQKNFNSTLLGAHKGLKWWRSTWEYFSYNATAGNFPTDDKLTFELDGGLSVEIPNSEMFLTAKIIDDKGGWSFVHGTQEVTLGTASFSPGVEPIVQLGAPFLSQVYIGVDYEAGTFFVAPINRETPQSSTSLKALGCDDFKDPKSDDAASKDEAKKSGGKKSNTGAIAGGVAGGIVALALIGGGFFFWRRRQSNKSAIDPTPGTAGYKKDHEGEYSYAQKTDVNPYPPPYQTAQLHGQEISPVGAGGSAMGYNGAVEAPAGREPIELQ